MTKQELVKAVSVETGLTQDKAKNVVDYIFDTIRKEVKNGGDLRMQGFGTFKLATRAARKGINPATKKPIDIPAKNYVKFKESSTFHD